MIWGFDQHVAAKHDPAMGAEIAVIPPSAHRKGFGFADPGGLPAAGAPIIDHGQFTCATCMIPNLARVVFSRYLRRPIGWPHVKHSVFGRSRRSNPQRGSAVGTPLQRAQLQGFLLRIAVRTAPNAITAAFAEIGLVVATVCCAGAFEFMAAWVRADRLAIFIAFRAHGWLPFAQPLPSRGRRSCVPA